jgi:hypothetical protein
MAWQCPEKDKHRDRQARAPVRGRVYTLDAKEADKSDNLVQGTDLIQNQQVHILFYSGATHSFISLESAQRMQLPIRGLNYELRVSTPSEGKLNTHSMCSPVYLNYQDKVFCLELYCLPMKGLEIILGMDWLHSHKVIIDCAKKTIHVPEREYEVYYSHHPTFDEDNLTEFDDGPRFIIVSRSF